VEGKEVLRLTLSKFFLSRLFLLSRFCGKFLIYKEFRQDVEE